MPNQCELTDSPPELVGAVYSTSIVFAWSAPAPAPAAPPVRSPERTSRVRESEPASLVQAPSAPPSETPGDRVLRAIGESADGLTQSQLGRATRPLERRLKQAVAELHAAGRIVIDVIQTGGRPKTIYRLAPPTIAQNGWRD